MSITGVIRGAGQDMTGGARIIGEGALTVAAAAAMTVIVVVSQAVRLVQAAGELRAWRRADREMLNATLSCWSPPEGSSMSISSHPAFFTRRRSAALVLSAGALVLAGCSASFGDAPADAASPSGATVTAVRVAHVSDIHEATGGTLLEGPVVDEDGHVLIVDVMAPPGEAKVLRVDPASGESVMVYTDDDSALTSLQVSPADGRLYVTDIRNGRILSMADDGADVRVFFEGVIDGTPMLPDDIAFDDEGNLFVSDTTGMTTPGADDLGRVVRIDADDAAATVIRAGLPSPNGISLSADGTTLWVSEYSANRIDVIGLDDSGQTALWQHPAIYVDGGLGRVDSNAVDADGNVYQAFHNKPEIVVYDADGALLEVIEVPAAAGSSATNLAIAPGERRGYITVSGAGGGELYSFDAAGKGTRQTNGG